MQSRSTDKVGEQEVRAEGGGAYRLFGLNLHSDRPFQNRLAGSTGAPDLYFYRVSEIPEPAFWKEAACIYTSRERGQDDAPVCRLYRGEHAEVIRFLEAADFYLLPGRIVCHLRDPAFAFGVEIWLLGTVLVYYLERQGIPALHAAAVSVEDRAVAFLSTNKGGKSSLAASLMRAGYPLLTDDILPVEPGEEGCVGRPGYPQMRMWPDQAIHFIGSSEGLERVHPGLEKRRVPVGPEGLGTFCDAARPLACCYLPARRPPEEAGGKIEIRSVPPQEALKALILNSFLPYLVEAAGLQPRRLQLLARMATQIPVRQLRYPSGVEHLPRVREAILEDVAALTPS